jgi:uncharacterized membrane protein (UPF0127 family)
VTSRTAPKGNARRVSRPLLALALTLAVPGLISACAGSAGGSSLPRGTVLLGPRRVPLRVEVAETDEARAHGLKGRTSLAADAGMAFLFDGPVRASFYMKDTLIPLAIAFWDQRGVIVAILDMTPCRAEPCAQYAPDGPFVGAVEANLGFFAGHGVQVGDRVELER